MSKRKRHDDAEDQDSQIEDQAIRIKVSRLRVKLDQSLKSLASALKLARGFERQKLSRRQKTATNEPHTLLRLREEVIILKQLQLGQTAKNHLFKHLSRTKRIRESPVFPYIYGKEPLVEPNRPQAEANVLARLFNSAPVKQALDEIMKSIFGVLGMPQVPNANAKQNRTPKEASGKPAPIGHDDDDEFNGFSSADSLEEEQNGQEHPTLDTVEAIDTDAIFKHRLAASDEESGDGELSSDDQNHELRGASISSDDFEDHIDSRQGRTSAKAQKMIPTTKTAFLPSLSMGGYYSGSESDGEDDVDRRSPPAPEIRKNRRGQRARQQLAEKKFGQKAKHLQNQKISDARNSGWDAKRGAVDHRAGQGRFPKQGRPTGRDSRSHVARTAPVKQDKPKSRDDAGSLHPSWEAAKKRKLVDPGLPKFEGKKITFD